MKKKILITLVLFITLFTLTACGESKEKKEENKDAIAFKDDYESMNEKTTSSGALHRKVTLSENNKFVEITPEEVVTMIENNETFYLYFGSKLCPWCRSVIEMADQISRDNEIEKIYYVDIWDDDGNEILRDKYSLGENNEPVMTFEGTTSYKKLLEIFNDLLDDYTLTDGDDNTINVGEKRIFAPTYLYVENGKPVRMTTGISKNQKDSRGELTEEILADEEKQFNNFFVNACDEQC